MMSSSRLQMAFENKKPYIVMLIVQAIYSGMALLSKTSMSFGMKPYVFVVYRQAFATLSLAPAAYFFERKKVPPLSCTLIGKVFFSALIGITICLNTYYYALKHTTATFASASTNLLPAITFVIALVLRIERMYMKELHGWAKLVGTIISVSGAFVFAFIKGPPLNFMPWYTSAEGGEVASTTNQFGSKGEFVKGPSTILLAMVLWSCWGIMQVFLMKDFPAKLSLIALQCFISFIQSTVWAVAMDRNVSSWKFGWDIGLISVAYCGVIVTALTYWLRIWTIEKKGPVFTYMFTPLSLIITAIISGFLWKETFYVGSVCGAVLLAGGLYSVLWGKSKEIECRVNEEKHGEETILESIKIQMSPTESNRTP